MGFFCGCWPNGVQLKHLVELVEPIDLVLDWSLVVVGGEMRLKGKSKREKRVENEGWK